MTVKGGILTFKQSMQKGVDQTMTSVKTLAAKIRRLIIWVLIIGSLVLILGGVYTTLFSKINLYSVLFQRKVIGIIDNVQRVQLNVSLIQNADPKAPMSGEMFSFSVAIKEPNGEIVTASSEDRQWAVVKPGQCAEAIYYPYPPWDLDKSGTYFKARLIKLSECPQ
jgi:hypothetical protein